MSQHYREVDNPFDIIALKPPLILLNLTLSNLTNKYLIQPILTLPNHTQPTLTLPNLA